MTLTAEKAPAPITASRLWKWFAVSLLLTVLILLACSLIGYYSIPLANTWKLWQWDIWQNQIWHMRLYRLAAAALVGAALATGGMALQGLMRNPLAEPYVLGISSGAGVGVLAGSWLAGWTVMPEWAATPVLALAGALLTCLVVYSVAQRAGYLDPYVLLLSGVIVNVINGALILTILQFVKQTDMIHFIGWGMGQIPQWLWFKPRLLLLCGGLILIGWLLLFLRSSAFNMLGLGDEVASSSGVPVRRLRSETFIVISLMTSAAVALAGPVGFVGLIVPHIFRLISGPDHRRLAILSGFGGAVFLMLADTACRIIGESFQLGELPVGVITAILGGPFFIFLLRRRQREAAV